MNLKNKDTLDTITYPNKYPVVCKLKPEDIKSITISTDFELDLVFCSCSVEIGKHHISCPNFGKSEELSKPYSLIEIVLSNGVVVKIESDNVKYTKLI